MFQICYQEIKVKLKGNNLQICLIKTVFPQMSVTINCQDIWEPHQDKYFPKTRTSKTLIIWFQRNILNIP